MKQFCKLLLTLLLSSCLLISCLPSVNALWDFSDGIPEDWKIITDEDQITAEHVLEPVNPNASQAAKNLYAYLCRVADSPRYISGQFDIKTNNVSYENVIMEYGKEPALYSCRYMVDRSSAVFETDANGRETTVLVSDTMTFTNVDAANKLLLEHYQNGNVLLIHADSVPRTICKEIVLKNKADEYDANCTDGINELDSTNPDRDMQAYAAWMAFQENLITALKALEASGVEAYMYRPWVEFQYPSFNGRTTEGREAFARVFQQTINMLIDAGLTGFLSCFSPGGDSAMDIRPWHPGSDYIDTYSFTFYADAENLGRIYADHVHAETMELFLNTGKPFGFSETSVRYGSDTVRWGEDDPRASCFDLLWSTINTFPQIAWVNNWDGNAFHTISDNLSTLGNDDGMLYWCGEQLITLDEMVDYRIGVIKPHGVAQLFTKSDASGDFYALAEKNYTASDLKAMGISASDIRALRLNKGYAISFWTNKDCTGDFFSYGFSTKNIDAEIAKNFKSLSIIRLENVAFERTEIYASVNDDNAWKANDGEITVWEGDAYAEDNEAEPGTAWLYIDLGKAYHVGRYVLKNASTADRSDAYNTVGFQIQYSSDCRNWKTVDTVANNTLATVDRNIPPVFAQYFRLLITDLNRLHAETLKGLATVCEWELYGVDIGLLLNYLIEDDSVDHPADDPIDGPVDDPVDEPVDKPIDDSVDEPIVDFVDDSVDDSVDNFDDEYIDEPMDDEGDESTNEEEPSENAPTEEEEQLKPVQRVITELYFPWWAWVLIAVGVLAVAGVIVLIVLKRRKKNADTVD